MLVAGVLAAVAVGVLLAAPVAMAMKAREVRRRAMAVVAATRVTRAFVSGVFRHMVEVGPVSAASIAWVTAWTMWTAVGVKTVSGKVVAVPCAGPAEPVSVMGEAVMRPVVSATSEFTRPRAVLPRRVEAVVTVTGERELAKPSDRMTMAGEIGPRATPYGAV
jgi:hypothetical protein